MISKCNIYIYIYICCSAAATGIFIVFSSWVGLSSPIFPRLSLLLCIRSFDWSESLYNVFIFSLVDREMEDHFGDLLFLKPLVAPMMIILKKSTRWVFMRLMFLLFSFLNYLCKWKNVQNYLKLVVISETAETIKNLIQSWSNLPLAALFSIMQREKHGIFHMELTNRFYFSRMLEVIWIKYSSLFSHCKWFSNTSLWLFFHYFWVVKVAVVSNFDTRLRKLLKDLNVIDL